ncbi:MAG: permease [Bacteroidetes bacterium]|nr:permease [Bacteroidota bacterium]
MNSEHQIIDRELLSYATTEEKATFYRRTYAHLAGGFLVFLILETLFLSTPAIVNLGLRMTQGYTWLIVLGLFMLATSQAEKMVARSTNRNGQYLGYFIYILAEAFIFVPLLSIAMLMTQSTVIFTQAFIITLALFGGLSLVVFVTKKDFSFMRTFLVVGSFVALGLIIVAIIFGINLGFWFSAAMVLLAGGAILYQTSNIVHRYHSDQYVLAALGLFASFMLLLWYVLQMLMSRD